MRTNKKIFFWKGGAGADIGPPITEGIVTAYTLDETIDPRLDCSVNGLDLTNGGTPVPFTPDGVLGNAADFNASSTLKLQSATDSVLTDMAGGDFSYCCWGMVVGTGLNRQFFAIGGGSFFAGDESISGLRHISSVQAIIVFSPQVTSYNQFGVQINGGVPENAYIFMAVKYDSATKIVSLRVNDRTFFNNTPLGVQIAVDRPQKILVGRDDGGSPHDGFVDQVIVYDRILSDAQFDFLYKGSGINPNVAVAYYFEGTGATFLKDESSNAINFINNGGTSAVGIKGTAIEFNGVDQGAATLTSTIFDNLRQNSFSINVWAYIDSTQAVDCNLLSIMSGIGTGEFLCNVTYDFSIDAVVAGIYTNAGITSDFLSQQITGSIPKNTWFSIQVSYDGPTRVFKMRLNDQSFSSVTTALTTNVLSGLRVEIGNFTDSSFFLNGRIDMAFIIDEALSDLRFDTLYMNGEPTQPTLPGRLPCDTPAGQVVNGNGSNVFNKNNLPVVT